MTNNILLQNGLGAPVPASYNWLTDLQRLQPLEAELALLPVGLGNECKGQMLGLLAKGWL